MSENSMMMGYAVKIPGTPSQDRIETLCDSFKYNKLNTWQFFYDEDGSECLVYLTEYKYEFLDNISTSLTIRDMLTISDSLADYIDADDLCLDVDMHFFVKVWYNGIEMGSIFKGEK